MSKIKDIIEGHQIWSEIKGQGFDQLVNQTLRHGGSSKIVQNLEQCVVELELMFNSNKVISNGLLTLVHKRVLQWLCFVQVDGQSLIGKIRNIQQDLLSPDRVRVALYLKCFTMLTGRSTNWAGSNVNYVAKNRRPLWTNRPASGLTAPLWPSVCPPSLPFPAPRSWKWIWSDRHSFRFAEPSSSAVGRRGKGPVVTLFQIQRGETTGTCPSAGPRNSANGRQPERRQSARRRSQGTFFKRTKSFKITFLLIMISINYWQVREAGWKLQRLPTRN